MLSRHSFLAVSSGLLLTLCFPKFGLGFLAWVALIPFLIGIDRCRSHRQVLRVGFLAGIVFFSTTFYWLHFVVPFIWAIVALIETVFFILFAWLVYFGKPLRFGWLKIIWIALAWTAVEILRSEIPVFGLGWNLLGYSQSHYPRILQSANLFGAYGLGFIIAFINACLFVFWSKSAGRKQKADGKRIFSDVSTASLLSVVFIIFGSLIGYGFLQLRVEDQPVRSIRVSVLQGNIPQSVKWEPEARDKILQIYSKLSELAVLDRPDLIVWPEAAFPGYFNRDYYAEGIRDEVKRHGISTVIGSPHWDEQGRILNSAYWLNPQGEIQNRYDKIYLVPFGEYVPLKMIFGWLEPLAESLGVGDFSAGNTYTVFTSSAIPPFAVLICFEDVFPRLARRFVKEGARMLTVITNDAWFGPTTAPYQHLQASIFRAVENGVPVVRAANTGISAFITKRGAVISRVEGPEGNDIFVTGKKTAAVEVDESNTIYQKGGYYFPYGALLLFGIITLFRRRLI